MIRYVTILILLVIGNVKASSQDYSSPKKIKIDSKVGWFLTEDVFNKVLEKGYDLKETQELLTIYKDRVKQDSLFIENLRKERTLQNKQIENLLQINDNNEEIFSTFEEEIKLNNKEIKSLRKKKTLGDIALGIAGALLVKEGINYLKN